jgi:pyruvate-formate lyase/deferrochelatase/peroxidase EfeB
MLTTKQSTRLSGQRRTTAHSRSFTAAEDFALQYAQAALPFCPEYAAYLTVHLKSRDTLSLDYLQKLAAELETQAKQENFEWLVLIGVGLDQWTHWCRNNGRPLAEDLFEGAAELNHVLGENKPYALDGGDLLFHIKSVSRKKSETAVCQILMDLDGTFDEEKTWCTVADSLHKGRIYGGRMLHGLISSVEPIGFSARAVIGDELPDHKGGCYLLTQKFVHDWQQLSGMADNQMEDLIGRDHVGNIIANDDERAHIKMVRLNDPEGLNYRHIAQSQPFRFNYKILTNGSGNENKYHLERLPEHPEIGRGKEIGVYQISYTKTITALTKTLVHMIGESKGYIKCRHLNYSHADQGSFYYIPSAQELNRPPRQQTLTVPMNTFFDVRSSNRYMFYNTKDYLHHLGNRTDKISTMKPWQPTDRVIELLGYLFSRWHDTWYKRRPAPELGHLRQYLDKDKKHLLELPVPERKGIAICTTLDLLSSYDCIPLHPDEDEPGRADPALLKSDSKSYGEAGRLFDTYRLHPREILVGVVPDYTLGSGYESMRYLNEDERQEAFVLKLSEAGAAGHNVPNYHRILQMGISGMLKDLEQRRDGTSGADAGAKIFYQSAIHAFQGVQAYLRNYAELARRIHSRQLLGEPDRKNLEAIAARMDKLAEDPPETFVEAAQLVFSMHCCMHIAGESVSIGRLDQLLGPFFEKDSISEQEAQEIIDCFWIKMDEKVLLNNRHFNDRLARGGGAITYEGGDFPQGAALNQWVQQVTVGGLKPKDGEPEDACNEVTRMCLRSARRLPMNAPCLSLRVHKNTPEDVMDEAVKLVLSGGGHPFLINDDKIVAALIQSGERVADQDSIVQLADARDMVCDGCFEALMAGKCEFAFSYVPVPAAVEMALNRGRTYAAAGPVHIMGLKESFRSRPIKNIPDFDEFYKIFLEHYRYKLIDFYSGMLSRYGNLNRFCPSPLLSPLIDGCLDRGCDMTAGGARYKLLAPLMNGIACAIDSLFAIRSMVFSDEAVFTLSELHTCLLCDWGYDMKEPFFSATLGEDRIAVQAERYKHLRMYALQLPKFGCGNEDVDRLARKLVRDLVTLAHDVIHKPKRLISNQLAQLQRLYGTEQHPFEFVITPGIATFEDYAGVGSFLGASADGRRCRQAVASDLSASPYPSDLSVPMNGRPAETALTSWAAGPAEDGQAKIDPIGLGLSNGSPVDINIRENFPYNQLQKIITDFASGDLGPNMISISCANAETLEKAQKTPERYDLLRMRMGGWSEFFVSMFPHHQEHHKRRPVFEAAESVDLDYYMFDWDDNILFMPTLIHMQREGVASDVTTEAFARIRNDPSFEPIDNDWDKAFSDFRDPPDGSGDFLGDTRQALSEGKHAPSFTAFKTALTNASLFAIVTARGHSETTLRKGVEVFIEQALSDEERMVMIENIQKFNRWAGIDIPDKECLQAYLDLNAYIGVSSPGFLRSFHADEPDSVGASPEEAKTFAVEKFVFNTLHLKKNLKNAHINAISFGFSDDDKGNYTKMRDFLKKQLVIKLPDVGFFVYDTSGNKISVERLTRQD